MSVQYLLDSLTCEDNRSSEQYILYLDKCPCIIENELLYHTLESLKENQRTVLLMDFWLGLTDEEISKRMEVTRRTVYNLRIRAFSKIRKYYENTDETPELSYH